MNMSQALKLTAAAVALSLVAAVGFVAWAVDEKAHPSPEVAAINDPMPTASQARATCRLFIERRSATDVQAVQYPDWRVKAPAHGGARWQVMTEYQANHGGGATTHHRVLCVIEFNPASGWRLVKLA